MSIHFNEDNTIEQMVIATLQDNGWKYIPSDQLPRMYSDVLVEPMIKEALIRLNPEIAAEPSRADEVIYKLRTLILSVQAHNLVTQNELFKKLIFEENSYPFGENGRMIPIRFFGTLKKESLALNEYVVTNQWIYPQAEGGKRLDIVLLINGFPVTVGELKTPVRSAITWLDAAGDISAYEKSIPAMFVTNIFNFATEGKCYRYGSINMPINMWGPWHTATHKTEGGLADVKISMEDMITPEKVIQRIATAYKNYCDDGDFARVATIQDIADNNYSLSIPLYVKPEVNEEEIDSRSVQEHYDSWRAASEMMKLSYAKLNAMLGKEAEKNE